MRQNAHEQCKSYFHSYIGIILMLMVYKKKHDVLLNMISNVCC